MHDLRADQYEVPGEKVSRRLAQRPGSYVVLRYVRPVVKRRDTQTLHCPSPLVGVIEGSRAEGLTTNCCVRALSADGYFAM